MVVVEALTKGRTAVLLGLGLAVYEGGGGSDNPSAVEFNFWGYCLYRV